MEPGDQPRTVDVDGMELHLDPDPDAAGEGHTALAPRVESWRRRSVAGAILTGIGLGLKEALEPKRDEPAVMIEASGEPPTPLPVEADLGGIMPGHNVVKIRPWLLSGSAEATGATADDGPASDRKGSSGSADHGDQGEPR